MFTRKSLRLRLIGLLSIAMLFSQLAIAAYACPAMQGSADAEASTMAGMPCAEMMAAGLTLDEEQPALCLQHCQFGSASQMVEPLPAVFLLVTALPPSLTVPVDEGQAADLHPWAENQRLRERPPPLAHSIAHCCFRI